MSQVTELLIRIRQQGDQQLTKLQGSLKNLAQQTAATNVNFKEVSEELRKIQATSTQSINNLRGYASTWREIANSVKVGTAEFKQASAEAAKLEAQLQKVQPGGRGRLARGAQIAGTIAGAGVFGGLEGTIGAGVGALVGGVPGAITGGAIGAQVGQFRQALGGTATYAAEIAKQRQALQLVTKDTGEYRKALEFIDKTSRDLAIPQEILTRQFTQLTASVKGAGGNVKDAEKAFIGVASGIRGTGGSLDQLDSALTATSQVFSKGKVSAEELRQQIGERLPGAFSLFAESMGKTPQELDKALENGEVSLQDFQKFAEKLFAEYGENAKIIADGPDAAGDRLRTSLSRLNESIGSLLKPIGASFQNTFAAIVGAIDAAVRKLNEFFGLGRGRQGQINDLQKILNVTDQRIQAFEKLGGKGGAALGVIEKGQYDVLVKRRTETFAQVSALRAAEKAAAAGTGEPSKGLPGIQPEAKTDQAAEKAAKLQARLAEQRNNIYRKSEQFLKKIQEATEDVSLETRLLGGNAFEAFENKYTKAVRSANKETEQLLKQVFDLAKAYKDAGGNLNITPLVRAIEDLNESQINLATGSAAQDMSDYWSGLSERFVEITDNVYAMTRAFEQNNDAMAGLGEGLRNYSNNVGTVRQAFAGLAESGVKKLEDSIFDLMTTGTANYQEFARSILLETTRMIIQQYTLKTIMGSLGFLGGGTQAAVSPLANVSQLNAGGIGFNPLAFTGGFGFAMGGIMTGSGPLQLKRYAGGGIASSPQLAMFGEGSRPEAYVPLPDGRSIPVTMRGNGEGANITVNVDARGSSVEGNQAGGGQLARAVAAAVQQELIKQQRPGGVLRR